MIALHEVTILINVLQKVRVIITVLDMHPPDASQVKALRMIAGVAFFVLSRFPRTLEQDKQLLAGPSLPDDMSMAVQPHQGVPCKPPEPIGLWLTCLNKHPVARLSKHCGADFPAEDAARLHASCIIT